MSYAKKKKFKQSSFSPTFHPFPRLPLELRQRIWDLSMEPRELHIQPGGCSGGQWPRIRHYLCRTKPPAILQACREARSHFQPRYSKHAFAKGPGADDSYIWVNFDIDTIRIRLGNLLSICESWSSIRKLAVECIEFNIYWDSYREDVASLRDTGLRELTIVDMGGPLHRVSDDWWTVWALNVMENFYEEGEPIPFFTRIIAPSDPSGTELTSENYRGRLDAYEAGTEETQNSA